MPIETTVYKEPQVIIRTATGQLTFEEVKSAITGVAEMPGYAKGMSAIWDLRKANIYKFTEDDLYRIVEVIKGGIEDRGTGFKLALVASEDFEFGMSRMWEAIAQDLPLEIKVFRDMDEARTWVVEPEEDEDG